MQANYHFRQAKSWQIVVGGSFAGSGINGWSCSIISLSLLKALLRTAPARTVEAFSTAVGALLTAFNTDECLNHFANADYRRSS